jgi:SulP family sulfate permease
MTVAAADDAPENRWGRWAPIALWLPRYRRAWLTPDLLAGLTVWALLVPEAMAYADIAGMPAETGLYAGLGAIIGYAIFGTSRQLFVGPSSTVAILSASTVATVSSDSDPVDLTIALALLVAGLLVGFGLLKLGFLSVFMSKPVLTGFTFGLGLTIAIGQANKLIGVEGGDGNFFGKLRAVLDELPDADARTTLIGFGALVVLFVMGHLFGHKVPSALIVVFGAIALSSLLDWEGKAVPVVGEIPASLPALGLPSIGLGDLRILLPGALGIVLVAYAESYGTAKSYADQHGQGIDADQEMIALGAANVGAGLFGGFTVDGSLSRTAAADGAGARSQMAMLICGVITLVTIVALTPLFEPLPEAVLAAIVIHAVWGTFDVRELRRLWRTSRAAFVGAVTALSTVCAIDILEGLLIAVGTSFVVLVYQASRPYMPRLGRVPGDRSFTAVESNPDAEEAVGVAVVRLDGPLFFANAASFHRRVDEVIEDTVPAPHGLVLDFETVARIDVDGADELKEIVGDLRDDGIDVVIARPHVGVREFLERAGVNVLMRDEPYFHTVVDAVQALGGRAPSARSTGGEP